MTQETLEIAKQLIKIESVTPADNGCQQLIANYLANLGFSIEWLPCGKVQNLWAYRGNGRPRFVFAGHTDVVSPGPLEQWRFPPFQPTVSENRLYGRGSADMKSSIAAMLKAIEQFLVANNTSWQGSIGLLITSDEEGKAQEGTRYVVEQLRQRHQPIDYCLIGEASSVNKFGDTIKIGRRGSLSGHLTIKGQQGHIAYPHLAKNAIHQALPALEQLTSMRWDEGHDYFPPTSLQISNAHAGTGANNVIPSQFEIDFNLRYSPTLTKERIQTQISNLLQQHKLNFTIDWHHSGRPFITQPGQLVAIIQQSIKQRYQRTCELSTSGGTSDGRFLIDIANEIVELGPVNATIHQINESIPVQNLQALTTVYQDALTNILVP